MEYNPYKTHECVHSVGNWAQTNFESLFKFSNIKRLHWSDFKIPCSESRFIHSVVTHGGIHSQYLGKSMVHIVPTLRNRIMIFDLLFAVMTKPTL